MGAKRCAGLFALLVPVALFGAPPSVAQTAPAPAAASASPAMIILDISRSMWGKVGGEIKVNSVRPSLLEAAGTYKDSIAFGLVVFGRKEGKSCGESEVLASPGEFTAQAQGKLQFGAGFRPKTSKPIASALGEAAKAVPAGSGGLDVVLITDGSDSCKANVCDTAKTLKQTVPGLRIHVLGYAPTSKGAMKALSCAAEATGGQFLTARNEGDLKQDLTAILDTVAKSAAPVAPAVAAKPQAAPTDQAAAQPPAVAAQPDTAAPQVAAPPPVTASPPTDAAPPVVAAPAAAPTAADEAAAQAVPPAPLVVVAAPPAASPTPEAAPAVQPAPMPAAPVAQTDVPLTPPAALPAPPVVQTPAVSPGHTDMAKSPPPQVQAAAPVAPPVGPAARPEPAAGAPPPPPAPSLPVPVTFRALLTEAGPKLQAGITWRVFAVAPGPNGSRKLVSTHHEAIPTAALLPGEYLVNAAYGLSNLTKKIKVEAGRSIEETFILNCGGLRLAAVTASGDALPGSNVHFDILSDEEDQFGNRHKILDDAKPGVVIRLNAGAYHLVSTYGDANATVRADVTVEPGKITEATVKQAAAPVTFKLVQTAGGEALADTKWQILTTTGDVVKEAAGALPTHILAAGDYAVVANHNGESYTTKFRVEAGAAEQIEVVMEQGPATPEALQAVTNPPPPPEPVPGDAAIAGSPGTPNPNSGIAFGSGGDSGDGSTPRPGGLFSNPGALLRPRLP